MKHIFSLAKKFLIINLVFILVFSSVAPSLLERIGLNQLATNLEVKEAQAAAPTFVSCGTPHAGSTTGITVAMPGSIVADDILLLFLETNAAITIPTPAGGTWTGVLNSPQTATTTTRLTVFWSRYNGTQTAPTTNDSGDHQVGVICAYRGIVTSGDPWDVTSGSVDTTSDTSGAITGAITTGADRLVVIVGAGDDDADTPVTGVSNANLTSISTIRANAETGAGGDGGVSVFDAVRAASGNYNTTTLTYTAVTTKAMMTIALKPAPPPTITISGTNSTPSADGRRVRVAVNGVLDATNTGMTVSGAWSISNVPQPSTGQVVTVFFDETDGDIPDTSESAAITKYDGTGDITGMFLSALAGKVSTGSADNPSMTLADFSYDCADDEDIPYSLVGSTLSIQGCSNSYTNEELNISDTLTVVGPEIINTYSLIINSGQTLTSSGASAINISGSFTQNGTFNAGTSLVTMTGTSNSINSDNAGTTFYDLTIDPASTGTITYASTGSFSSVVSNNLVVAANDTLSINSSIFITLGTTAGAGSLTLNGTIAGSGTFQYRPTAVFPTTGTISSHIRFDAIGGNVTVPQRAYGGILRFINQNTTTARTITLGTGASQTITAAGFQLDCNTGNAAYEVKGSTWNPNITITGNFSSHGSSCTNKTLTTGSGNWSVSGNLDFTNVDTFTASTGNTFTLNGTGNFSTSVPMTFYNLTFGDGTVRTTTITTSNSITVDNVLTFNAGTVDAPSISIVLKKIGTPVVFTNPATLTGTDPRLTFTGASTGTVNIAGGNYGTWDIRISSILANSVIYNLGGNLNTSDLFLVQAGAGITGTQFSTNGFNLTSGNSFLFCDGGSNTGSVTVEFTALSTITTPGISELCAGSYNLNLNSSQVFVTGSIALNAAGATVALNAGTSTVTLNGISNQTLSGTMTGANGFNNLIITNSSGTVSGCATSFTPGVTFSSAVDVNGTFTIATTALAAGVYVQYGTGLTYTFNNISWVGTAAKKIYFRNSALGSGTWLLKVTGTQSVSYADVARSDASVVGGSTIVAGDGTNTDCSNNTNWNFSAPVTVTATSTGTPTVNFDSGGTSQYVGAAFRFQQDTGTAVNITALTLTDTGTVIFDDSLSEEVSNNALSYKTGDSGTCATGGETSAGNGNLGSGVETVSWGALNIPVTLSPNFTCVYLRLDAVGTGSIYPKGGSTIDLRIASSANFTLSSGSKAGSFPLDPTGATTIRPVITGYTNSTESGLDYAVLCSGCGARLGGGSGFRQTVVILGYGFGADPGLGSRDTATNKVEIAGASTTVLADDGSANTNVSAWSNTSITIRTDTNIVGNRDDITFNEWGTNFGGATALKVTAGSTAVPTNLNFYIFPQVTSVTGGVTSYQAREYDAGDTDGVITLNGTRFGTASTGGNVTIVSQTASTTSWSNTAITAQVPTTIVDTVNTGNLAMTQGAGSNNKTHTYEPTGFRILSRIISNTPTSGIIGDVIQIDGNHFCQSGTCPASPPVGAADKVEFGTTGALSADFVTSCSGGSKWSDTQICVKIPAGISTGSQPTKITSFTDYTSNTKACTVNANTTTLATSGSDPSATTIAPGASATDVDLFTLQTNGGTEVITTVTVNLSTNSGVLRLAITDNANAELGFTTSPATGSNVITVTGMEATTSLVTFKVRVTPLSHAAMPAPAGASYSITAPVTAWAGGNTHAGTDSNTNALTIDNTSPAGTTGANATPGDAQVTVSWTNPGDGDFQKVIIYCKTSSVTEAPTEGSDPSVDGAACDGTARVKYSGSVSPQIITGLTNSTLYYFRIYARDTNGNFTVLASTQEVSATPTLTQTLTVSTVGTQALNLNSGSTAQHIGGGATAAFTLQINTGSSNVTSVKVSEAGSIAMANLFNSSPPSPKLYYEDATSAAACAYGGAESNVSGAAPVGETITFALPTVPIALTPNVTCLYFVTDVSSSAVGGQTIELEITDPSTDVTISSGVNSDTVKKSITGTTTVRPVITGYTNSTESGLNYASSCSGCGARIGGGAGFKQTVVISGYGFGADPGANSRDTATNKVEVVGASTNLIDDNAGQSNVTAWSNTSITITTDSAVTGDTDTDWGTNFGGATALKVTAGLTAVATNLNFYIFPQVTSITQPGGFPADSAREYDAGDTDGVITLNGTRFGTALGTGYVRILGCDSTTCSSPTGSATTDSWSNTAIAVQVPSVIADNVYTGLVVMKQGTGGNSGTNTYLNTFRILPRITDLAPSSALIGDAITVNGNHFCQSGTCPSGTTGTDADLVNAPAFTTNDRITFTSGVVADYWGASGWTNTAVSTQVPTSAITGNVVMKSNAYTSNGSLFTLASGVPDDPTSLDQFKDSGFTQQIAVETGVDNTMPLYLKMTMQAPVSGGTLYPQVEYKAIGTPFVCVGTAVCASDAVEGTGVAGPGPEDGSKSISPADNTYHWQARVKHTRNSIDYYSAWVSFGANTETVTDFKVDTTPPVVSSVSSGSPGTNGATITWSTATETSTSQVQYNTTGTFVTNCATNNDCTTLDTNLVNAPHTTVLSNLNSGTTYYYRVRSKDAADNETIDVNNTFTTQTVSNPAKTVKAYINGATGSVSAATTYYFTVNVPETAPTVTSAYIEVSGLVSGGFSGTITVVANSATPRAYSVSTAASTPTLYRFLYPINSPNTEVNLNLNNVAPCSNDSTPGLPLQEAGCNKVVLTPSTGSINVLSANIIINYSYTP